MASKPAQAPSKSIFFLAGILALSVPFLDLALFVFGGAYHVDGVVLKSLKRVVRRPDLSILHSASRNIRYGTMRTGVAFSVHEQ